MAASLKEPRQFFGICNHLISSRCLHASAVTFKNVTATERKRKKVPLSWSDVQDTPALKSKARERRSSARHTLKKSSDGAGKVAEATGISDREALKRRRRMPEPVVWSDSAAETMLLYKDDDILAVNKPAGLAVHGGPRLHDDLTKHLSLWQYDALNTPELAHRLDKDTSGVLLLTRHAESAKMMAKLFHDRRIVKKYWAITVSVPEDMEGSIKIPIGTKNISEKKRGSHGMNRVVLRRDLLEDPLPLATDPLLSHSSLPSNVHMAHTDYKVLSLSELAPKRSCLLLVQPITGFKHQLRVHLADGLMCPVLGDYKFGGPLFRLSDPLRRKMKSLEYVRGYFYLHEAELEIPDYRNRKGKPLVIKAPPPPHFKQTAEMLGLSLPHN